MPSTSHPAPRGGPRAVAATRRLLLISACAATAMMSPFVRPTLEARWPDGASPPPPPPPPPPSTHRRLMNYRKFKIKWWEELEDPRSVVVKSDAVPPSPFVVCGRTAPISPEYDFAVLQKYADCPLLNGRPQEETALILLEGTHVFGRTGNNLVEFLHAMQYRVDEGVDVAIMFGSWALQAITSMWMQMLNGDVEAWRQHVERALCVKIIMDEKELKGYKEVLKMETRDLFIYQSPAQLDDYAEHQGHVIRQLYRDYNDGTGREMSPNMAGNMCSMLEEAFGRKMVNTKYSVIHSRTMEEVGEKYLRQLAKRTGCDERAALDMEPDYVKGILEPLGMMGDPILFITDHQNPQVLERLMADPDIGPNMRLVRDGSSWLGGDIMAAVAADVFIGNPASTFSGFIAKSRIALGHDNNFLFRKKDVNGTWVDTCHRMCVFDKSVMDIMA